MTVPTQSNEHSEPNRTPDPKTRIDSLRNGLVGGVVAILLSFLPLSTVLGGGVAGYLSRGSNHRGADAGTVTGAGAIAGIVAFIPYLLVGLSLGLSPTVTLPGPDLGLSPVIVVAGTTAFALVYVVGLSVLGSLLGKYISDERQP